MTESVKERLWELYLRYIADVEQASSRIRNSMPARYGTLPDLNRLSRTAFFDRLLLETGNTRIKKIWMLQLLAHADSDQERVEIQEQIGGLNKNAA